MAIGGSGEPEAGQELDLSREAPSPAAHEDAVERVEIEAAAEGFSGRVSFWVRGRLLPSAELLLLWLGTGLITVLAWAICHVEGFPKEATLAVSAVAAIVAFLTGRAYLRHR